MTQPNSTAREFRCECLDRGHDSGDHIHCLCGGVLPRVSMGTCTDCKKQDGPCWCGDTLGCTC